MFSIAAINDTDSRGQWEPLAPTKEALEFHLTQAYHDGLLKLQAKDYEKARELLESVLKDPLISNAEVDNNTTDGHLLQLKFLVLKNLATVFLQQGSGHYESALRCYLQAVEIDNKDSVVWNQLGTLSCSMGSLSISRWAFEQGLLCSPNNWNCMEKLLEVLIAIGDEVTCLSVAELILRHWPSHSRALHVKNTIEETESAPFAPRDIDKLEPKHVRLKFHDKRKAPDENLDEGTALKKLNQNIELQIAEASWAALIDGLLGILLPLNGCGSEVGTGKLYRSGDVRLSILFPPCAEIVMEPVEKKEPTLAPSGESMPPNDNDFQRASSSKEKESNLLEEQPQERRSTRLESLRSRKPGKEELDFTVGKDLAKIVLQLLEPFVISKPDSKGSEVIGNCSVSCADQANSLDMESRDVANFVRETSKNYGAYHIGHLLLEHAASKSLVCLDAHVKFLELEKLLRNWGQDRTPECSLFLAELYYDIGSSPSNSNNLSEFLSEASYHLCKIIESVALDHPFYSTFGNKNFSSFKSFQGTDAISPDSSICESSHLDSSLLSNKSPFWARYFWLSGKLSVRDGNKAKAYEEFCISMSLLAKNENADNSCMVQLPHCKISKELTVERILHEINLLKVDFLLEKTLGEMIEKEVFVECVTLLAPLLFSANSLSPSLASDPKGDGVTPVELSALDILIKACQKIKPMDMEVYLTSHTRKLQILMALARMGECVAFGKAFHQKSVPKMLSGPEMVSSDGTSKHWNDLVTEEVKEILQCVSQVKNFIDQSGESNGIGLVSIFSDIQSLLLAIMYNIANNVFCKKSSMQVNADHLEQKQSNCFIDAAIAFCKLQHLDSSVTVKSQVELIVATHDLLAEYGLCCAGEGGEGEEATFLKFAIKHLLALDMKLKSSFNSSSREISPDDRQPSNDNDFKTSENEISSDKKGERMCGTHNSESITAMKDDIEGITSKGTPSFSGQEKDNAIALQKQCTNVDKINLGEKCGHQLDEGDDELSEDEKEELELMIDNALDQCFFCLYGLNLRSDSSYDDELAVHKNTSRGDYQTKEQCADVFQYILPSAKASSRTGLVKLRRVLRTIRKHFPQPPEEILAGNIIDKFFDADLCEEELSEMAGSEGYLETVTKMLFPDGGNLKQYKASLLRSSEPYLDVYSNLYYFLAQSEEMNATDKWPGFVLTKEGEEFVQQNANLFKYDLLYNPLRFESWQRLANIYDEEVDLLLNDGSKHINVSGWRKNITLPQRVETSRRRSRRCLLISLALAKTSEQQCEIHELLALVYYDSLQNVVPFYDQRSLVPSRDAVWRIYCENSMRHFKKALMHKQDWSHAFYIGKLCEKLGYSYETSLSYYDKAIALNPSAVDPFYRMHASRLKLLWNCGKQNVEVLKVLSTYFFSQSLKDAAMDIISKITPETSLLEEDKLEKTEKREEVWNMLYNDCLSALEICVGGDLKHFHKARFMLAQGLYKKGGRGDLQKAKDELSFCFRSSRSCFTINMWEIDGMVKKGKRKAPGLAGNKKALEVNLPESSRKFITCIRKYLLFYLKLLEETGDICTLDRAYVSLRSDKRFSLCIEDLVPVALGRHIKALVLSINQVETAATDPASSFEHQLEKIFGLFMEQGTLWPEICSLPEIRSPEISESSLYGYLHQYIVSLERNGKLETLEAINERIRKRFKNPKLSNSNCAKVCRHASSAWYRSIIIGLASITPLQSGFSNEVQTLSQPTDGVVESSQQLCVDLQTHEIWNSSFEDSTHLESLQEKWNPTLAKINNIVIKKASDGDLETANTLLRSSYNFYRESSCVMLPSSLNLSLVPSRLVKEKQFPLSIEGVEPLDLSIPRKLLLWAYALLNGRYASISVVVKYCEENAKLKMKRGAATSSAPQNTNTSIAASSHTDYIPQLNITSDELPAAGSGKEAASHGGGSEVETTVVTSGPPVVVSESDSRHSANPLPSSSEGQRSLLMAPQLHPCNNEGERGRSSVGHEGDDTNKG